MSHKLGLSSLSSIKCSSTAAIDLLLIPTYQRSVPFSSAHIFLSSYQSTMSLLSYITVINTPSLAMRTCCHANSLSIIRILLACTVHQLFFFKILSTSSRIGLSTELKVAHSSKNYHHQINLTMPKP